MPPVVFDMDALDVMEVVLKFSVVVITVLTVLVSVCVSAVVAMVLVILGDVDVFVALILVFVELIFVEITVVTVDSDPVAVGTVVAEEVFVLVAAVDNIFVVVFLETGDVAAAPVLDLVFFDVEVSDGVDLVPIIDVVLEVVVICGVSVVEANVGVSFVAVVVITLVVTANGQCNVTHAGKDTILEMLHTYGSLE